MEQAFWAWLQRKNFVIIAILHIPGQRELAVLEHRHGTVRLKPDSAAIVGGQTPDFRSRQSIGRGQPPKVMIPITHKAVGGGNPERAIGILRQAVDGIINSFRCVKLVKLREAEAIKTG